MPTARVTVTAVSDEGDTVIVWGRPPGARSDSQPIGYAFRAESDPGTVALAEQASRLAAGTEAVIDYVAVTGEWCRARGLAIP